MKKSLFFALFAFLFSTNCGNEGSTKPTESDATPICGPGTVSADGLCIAEEDFCDNKDNDADGLTDEDCYEPISCGEGTSLEDGKCVPLPQGNSEVCDGIDNDEDGLTDEEYPEKGKSCTIALLVSAQYIFNEGGYACIEGELVCLNPPTNDCSQMEEICGNNLDDNCNNQIDEGCPEPDYDEDNDGYSPFDGDCNDSDPNVNPGAIDWCDQLNNDCDDLMNEDDPNLGHPCVADLYDPVTDNHYVVEGSYVCSEGGLVCDPPTLEDCQLSDEICNDIFDNNCNGQIDEFCSECQEVPTGPVEPGDVVKGTFDALYFISQEEFRYVFPNEPTYYSWHYDTSCVKTVSDQELADIPLAGNVCMRYGTYLVKIQSIPTVYAVSTNCMIYKIADEQSAVELFGADWADRIYDTPDAFWPNYTYTVTDVELFGGWYPDGFTLQATASDDVYLIWNGQKRLFASEEAFTANRFQEQFIIEATQATLDFYPDGPDINGCEPELVDDSQGGGGVCP